MKELQKLIEAINHKKRDETLAPLEKQTQKEVAALFNRQRVLFMEYLKKSQEFFVESQEPEDIIAKVIAITEGVWSETLREASMRALQAGMVDAINDFDVPEIAFNLRHPKAEQVIAQRGAELVTKINDTTRGQINGLLQKGKAERWSYKKVAGEIEQRFKEFAVGKPQLHIRSRAELVAVTENAIAYGEGNREASLQLEDAGLEMEKSWSTTGDDRVSDGCQENAGVGWIPVNELFPSGHQNEPRFPSCRCAVLYRRKR